MEQRRLRLGDILDDYCPRERRLTNHAVVAMIEEERQTDPLYDVRRGAPVQGRKDSEAAEERDNGDTLQRSACRPDLARRRAHRSRSRFRSRRNPLDASRRRRRAVAIAVPVDASPRRASRSRSSVDGTCSGRKQRTSRGAAWRSRKVRSTGPLIRAQLPRIEGQKEERRAAGVHDSSARQRSFPRRLAHEAVSSWWR